MSKRRKRYRTLGRRQRRRWRLRPAIEFKSVMMLLLLMMLMLLLFCISASLAVKDKEQQQQQQREERLIIRTDLGQLFRGTKRADSRVAAFLGLRYAGAPVKRLRFMPPTPFTYAQAASNSANQLVVHDARRPGPICMQRFPVDFTRQQLDYMNELRNSSHRLGHQPGGQEAKFNLQLELMDELLPSGSFFAHSPHRKWRSAQSKGLDHLRARKLLELEQSEDCLNLNIYTPIEALKDRITTPTQRRHLSSSIDNNNNSTTGSPSQLLPVLVLIQADSFDYGSPSATISASSAAQFARDNRLLVITFNFRLNLLGFPPPKLQHITQQQQQQQQHITQQQQQHHRTNNNLGLLDQVALLHWLQANVRSFGGSPRNVTLMGLRAGAICVNLLMLSPLAKGLFSRAILEDGAALSPMVANNLQYISNSQQQQVALQHVRLIAQLSGCAGGGGGGGGNNSDVSLMFECLKSAPIEQLMQQIPFGLLVETGSSGAIMQDGQVALARRWHRPLELLFRTIIELDHQLVPARLKMTLNEFSNQLFGGNEPTAANQQVNVNRTQLDKLIAYLIITKQAISGATDQKQSSASVELVSELLDDLLNAIYLPSNETLVSPLYAPHLDTGTLLHHHEHDLSSALLAPRSLFSRHDLLIGSSRPLVDLPSGGGGGGGAVKSMLEIPADIQLSDISGGAGLRPTDSANYQFASLPVQRFGRRVMEQVGLSEEQAIQQVNLFVRTFYRFHQQEIANSIINHYFLNDKTNSADRQKNTTASSEQNKDDDKQLHLLRSLINLYQDSLVSVPLIKTALIHSMKQLESLAEFYISQRLVKLNERLKILAGDLSKLQLNERDSLADSAAENFRPFLGQLYASFTLWPLQLMSTTGNGSAGARAEVLDTIHSTYLYQFDNDVDSFALVEQILAVINELAQKLEQKPKGRAILLAEVRRNLVDNLLKPMLHHQYQHYAQSLSLSCGLQDSDGESPMGQLFRWQCARIGRQIVAKFVAHGNVNVAQAQEEDDEDAREPIELKLDHYEANCVHQQQQQAIDADNNSTQQDHLVIAVDEGVTGSDTQKSECENQLNRLSMDYLLAKLSKETRSMQSGNEWRVFDVFEQQMATLTATSVGRQPAWTMDGRQFADNNTYDTSDSFARSRQQFDRKIAFWANFIPTLNCSRTQPIGPASLQLFSQAPNSTLLNMNLNFNCQSVGAVYHNTDTTSTRTANSLIRALELKIKTAISEHLNRLIKQQQLRLSTSNSSNNNNQNHHSLRMATTSNELGATPSAGSAQDDPPNSAADQQRTLFGSDGNMSLVNTWLTVDGEQRQQQQSFFASATGNRHQTLLGLWLIAGAILLGSTILTSGCVLMKHLKRQRSPRAVGQLNNKTISMSIISTGDTTPPPPPPVMLQVLPPAPVNCSASSTTPSSSSSSSTSTSLVSQQQQQQQESLGPAYEFNHGDPAFQNHTYEPNQSMNEESEEQQQQYLMPIIQGTRYIEHTPECNTSGAQVQMQNGNINMEAIAQAFSSGSEANTTTTTQRALSSVSLLSSSTITNNNNNNNTTHGTMSNGNNATRQQVKKRVKISDPKRQHFDDGNTLMITKDDQILQPVYLNGDFLLPQLEGQSMDNYCPIHRSSSTYLISATGPNNQAHIANNDNCDTNLNDATNRLDFLNNGQFLGYMSGSESFNNAMNETDNYHHHQNHLMTTTPQLLAVGQLGSQQEIYQGNHHHNHHQMRSINRKQQRRVKQAPGAGRVCLVYNRIGLNNDVMNAGTSDQLSRNSTTLDR